MGALVTGAQISYVEVAATPPLQLTCAKQNGVLREQGIRVFYAISLFLSVDNEFKSKANKTPVQLCQPQREPASQMCLLLHHLATSDPPCAISSFLYPLWQLDPSWSLVYLGTKGHEQMRKPDSLPSPGPILHPGPCPLGSLRCHSGHLPVAGRAGWRGRKAQCPVYTAWARSRGKQSPAPGSLRTTVPLPASPEAPAFCSQGQEQRFPTWRVFDGREPSRSCRTTPSEHSH